MAGAEELLLFLDPGDGAPQMGTLAGKRQETAAVHPHQVELPALECRHGPGGKGFDRPGRYDGVSFGITGLLLGWSQKGKNDPEQLDHRRKAQRAPEETKESAS